MKCFFLILFINALFSCTSQWVTIENSPWDKFRHDDIYFLNTDTGFIVNNHGEIWKTLNGGKSWIKKFVRPKTFFRCTTFLNDTLGFVGTLGNSAWASIAQNDTVLYRTEDGGNSWEPVLSEVFPNKPQGLCGLYKVNDSSLVGVGRVSGPTRFIKTTDYGKNWFTKNMTQYCGSLIEAYFTHPDTGLVFGGTHVQPHLSKGIILNTFDGGESWDTLFITSRSNEWCWKVFFSSPKIGYVTLQSSREDSIYFLKTLDGGLTWKEKMLVRNQGYWAQGVGFLNDTVGWIGGDLNKPYSFFTNTGGRSWNKVFIGSPINRMRKINDTVMYSVGERVYRYWVSDSVSAIVDNRITCHMFPSPADNYLFLSPKGLKNFDDISIFDYAGREMKAYYSKQENTYKIDVSGLEKGIYLLIAKKGKYAYKKMFVKDGITKI